MKNETEKAIKLLSEKITGDIKPDEAMKFTQSALNLAHVLAIIYSMKK